MKKLLFTLSLFTTLFSFSQSNLTIKQTECDPDNTNPFKLNERIIAKEIRHDSLIIVLGKRETCCAKFKGSYKIENDTVKIMYENIGDECFCTCFYELTFKIPDVKSDSIQTSFNNLYFRLNNKKTSEFNVNVDTLENGNIIWSKFENDELIMQIEYQDSVKIYKQYYKGTIQRQYQSKNVKSN